MKIIGMQDDSTYLAIVSHTELEKSVNLYYGNMKKLKVGDSIDLGQGYNFSSKIESVCRDMLSATKSFDEAKATLMAFAVMVAENKGEQ